MTTQSIPYRIVRNTRSIGTETRSTIKKLNLWIQRYRSRQQLASLDDRILSDIGISRYDANHEASKPFWKM